MARSQLDAPRPALESLLDQVNAEQMALSSKQKKALDDSLNAEPSTPMDDESLRSLSKKKLVRLVEVSDNPRMLLSAVTALLDRIDGKPAQSIAMKVEDTGLAALTTGRLLALERNLARLTGTDALVIPPMPKKLSEQD